MNQLLNGKTILVTVSGPDGPGITARLMKIISLYNVDVLDMGQAVTHGLLSLSFVLGFNSAEQENGKQACVMRFGFSCQRQTPFLDVQRSTSRPGRFLHKPADTGASPIQRIDRRLHMQQDDS